MKTSKQKQATKRNFALMRLQGMQTNLQQIIHDCKVQEIKDAISTVKTYMEYAEILITDTTSEEWNEQRQT